MPYRNVQEAEARNPGIGKLPAHAKAIWTAAFNASKKRNLDDSVAAKIAWSAVTRAGYKKKGDKWVKMDDDIMKVTVLIDGDNIAFGIPFSKVDVKTRTVEGFATLDNVDKADEVVDFSASKQAFSDWIGNVREMHAPKAVGKAIEISEKQYEKNGKTYNGFWVKSKISKGAEDTWQKCLDGTLAGYSIGGKVLERRPEVIKSDGDARYSVRNITRITKYHLGELSLVDNPMNPLTVFAEMTKADSILKNDNGVITLGDAIVESKSLFYCDTCDVAKTEELDVLTTECVTCDNMMQKIGQVNELPTISDLQKIVGEYNLLKHNIPAPDYSNDPGTTGSGSSYSQNPEAYATPDTVDSLGRSSQTEIWDPNTQTYVETDYNPTPEIVDVNPQLMIETNLPQGVPRLGAQKAEGVADEELVNQTLLHIGETVLPREKAQSLIDAVSKALKGRTESEQEEPMYKEEEIKFFEALINADMYKVNFGNKTPPKGYPKDKSQYADPANFKYPIDSAARIRAAMVYYNHSGQRGAGGYSMGEWAAIGRRIAAAANRVFGSGHSYSGGSIKGPNTANDKKKAELVFNLQKNDTNGNSIVDVLQRLFGLLHNKANATEQEGGENLELNVKEALDKVLEIFDVAKSEAEEIIKSFTVQNLNDENASNVLAGSSDPGDAGVGTSDANDGGASMDGADTTVAQATALATPDAGPEKVVPNAIATDGTNADPGVTDASAGPANVLPHADAGATTAPVPAAKAEDAGDLQKMIDYFDKKFSEVSERLESVENSGATKKSGETNELAKAESKSLWNGVFY